MSFRKGPSGHLRQDPSDQAMELKRRPSPTFPAQSQDTVRADALTVVVQRGGDETDRLEVMGEYVLQFGKYKGKTFRWLLENDVGYTMYPTLNKVEQEESEGTFHPEGYRPSHPRKAHSQQLALWVCVFNIFNTIYCMDFGIYMLS